jgi:hypothetical protein
MVWHHAYVVKYKVILLTFLNYRDRKENVFYTADTEFEQEFLSAITSEEILEWMNVKAFGVGNPAEHDVRQLFLFTKKQFLISSLISI